MQTLNSGLWVTNYVEKGNKMNSSAFVEMVAKKFEERGDIHTAKLIKTAYHLGFADAGGQFEVVKPEEEKLQTESPYDEISRLT